MFHVPSLEEDNDDEAFLAATDRMNMMVQTLVNKLPKFRVYPLVIYSIHDQEERISQEAPS